MITNKLKNVAFATLTASALSIGLTNAAVISVVNGGFENPGVTTYTDTTATGQWNNVSGWSGIAGETYTGSGTTTERANTGTYGGKITYWTPDGRTDGGVLQVTSHTIAAGEEFTLTFYHASTFGDAPLNYSLFYGDETQIISTASNTVTSPDFVELTLTGAATAAMAGQSLGILFDTPTNGFSVIDDVSLSFVVPEPSSAALLGLGGLALVMRRRK